MPDSKNSPTGAALPGVLVYVVGPSGAGKDTLIARVQDMPTGSLETRPLHVARRRITRPAGGSAENHHEMTDAEFARALQKGEFVMHWESHGLSYGISREIDGWLAADAVVIVNGSREYLPEAAKMYPHLVPVLIRVTPEALRQRLAARGRETAGEIDERIRRAALAVPDVPGLVVIDNSGPLESAVAAFSRLILNLREDTAMPHAFAASPASAASRAA
ncbi:ribose 1,5-bisphosphokinase [uncultured delta proteobacterium]|uniref:Ribose 1,5-bisphosphate phosphokinase PhnN n=1 Tax=uncultured delta proteobacterium TaxID=34034 RepID=A0A212K6D2_9DELT|nr:ribose 1,5-bisphosphokinase [uncultured delta proteobacterium]